MVGRRKRREISVEEAVGFEKEMGVGVVVNMGVLDRLRRGVGGGGEVRVDAWIMIFFMRANL